MNRFPNTKKLQSLIVRITLPRYTDHSRGERNLALSDGRPRDRGVASVLDAAQLDALILCKLPSQTIDEPLRGASGESLPRSQEPGAPRRRTEEAAARERKAAAAREVAAREVALARREAAREAAGVPPGWQWSRDRRVWVPPPDRFGLTKTPTGASRMRRREKAAAEKAEKAAAEKAAAEKAAREEEAAEKAEKAAEEKRRWEAALRLVL